jgi:hypothetical protein
MKRKKKLKTAITLSNTSAFALRTLILGCLTLFLTINNPMHAREQSKPPDYALIFGTVWGP